MKWTPRRLKFGLNIYPPYLGAGVSVTRVDDDWRELRVSMKLRWYNRNAVGSHFGGSLFSMVDPHLMLLFQQLLGDEYVVWDKAASIDFVRPGRGTVYSTIRISDDELATIRRETAGGETYLPEYEISILNSDNDLVARVKKVLYVRRKSEVRRT